ncbi:hypothetical protein M9H77_08112 [Catharanthus roseus]|uniref:Uncharacterized protein n=1 Tax=Catharanthus roseus TaxID=4058 RepID=A0ACC0BX29_CATRO|nr:hypothetical protein M9H77_08112 [Catharanthus roseus]
MLKEPYNLILAPDLHPGRGPTSIYLDIASCSAVGRLPNRESRGLKTEVGPTADLISSGRSGAQQATEVRPGVFGSNLPEGHITYNLVPRGTQMPYSAAVDVVVGLGASQVVSELQCSFIYKTISLAITTMKGHIDTLSFRIDDGLGDRGLRSFESSKKFTCSETRSSIKGFRGHKYYFTLAIGECKDEGDDEDGVRISNFMVSTPTDVSKIAEVKYLDCEIYAKSVIISGELIALPSEGYGVILAMDGCLNIMLK